MAKRARDGTARGKPSPQDGSFLGDSIECYVCTNRMLGEIFSCRGGHSVCEGCYGKLPQPRKCPQCRVSFPASRNRSLEAVVQKYSFACEHGCGRIASPAEIIKHERECDHAPVLCPWPGCNVNVSASSLKGHFKDTHAGGEAGGNDEIADFDYQIAQKSGSKFIMNTFESIECTQWTTCCPFGGAVQDGAIIAAKVCLGRVWHIRAFHFFKPRRVTIKLGDGASQITFTDKTESIRSYKDWDPSILAKAGRTNGFLFFQEKLAKISYEKLDCKFVTVECIFE